MLEDWRTPPPDDFDVIVSLHTLEHVEKPLSLVQTLSARLVPGGLFLFVVPNPGGLGHRLKRRLWFAYRDPAHVSLLSRGPWVTLAGGAGLSLAWVRGDGMWVPPYVPLVPHAIQRAIFGAPAALQLVSPLGRPFLPSALGECLIVAATRPQTPDAPR